jgi:RNA polymerase sigma factor (sigma-70 family)
MPDESAAFRDYKSDPTTDSLIRLLRSQQDRIYRLCLQVLRRPHDAEDASQEVLIRIAEEARRFDDHDIFRRWVYRVSLNAALETARKAARRRAHETRAAMKDSPREALDEESRRALFEGISKLDDVPRSLLLDHYFEGETLESLGSREGVSPQAVSKRLDRAREELRRAIPASALGAFDLSRLFVRGTTTSGVPDLVSGPVLAKVAAVAGGTLMASKTSLVAAVVMTGILCLAAGTGLGLLLKSRPEHVAQVRAPVPETRITSGDGKDLDSHTAGKPAQAVLSPGEAKRSVTSQPPERSLAARLNRYREWRLAWEREKAALGDKLHLDDQFKIRHFHAKRKEMSGELAGLRELVVDDPAALLEFMKEEENGPWLDDLIVYGFGFVSPDPELGFVTPGKPPVERFPSRLTDALLELMSSGTAAQKGAAMAFFGHVSNQPPQFEERWRSLMEDADPAVQSRAAQLVSQIPEIRPEFMAALTRVGRTSTDVRVRVAVANSMSWIRTPEAQDYLIERLEAATEANEVVSLACAMTAKFYAVSSGGPAVPQEKFMVSSLAAVNRGLGDDAVRYVIMAALYLPSDKARPVLDRARAVATTTDLQDSVTAMLRKIDTGEAKREDLEKLLWPSRNP